jgi:hypothetical protein
MDISGQFEEPAALPQKRTPMVIKYEAAWAQDLVWTFWKSDKLMPLLKFEPLSFRSVALSLHRLHYQGSWDKQDEKKFLQVSPV